MIIMITCSVQPISTNYIWWPPCCFYFQQKSDQSFKGTFLNISLTPWKKGRQGKQKRVCWGRGTERSGSTELYICWGAGGQKYEVILIIQSLDFFLFFLLVSKTTHLVWPRLVSAPFWAWSDSQPDWFLHSLTQALSSLRSPTCL